MFSAMSSEPLLWTTGWVLLNSLWLVTAVWGIHWFIQRVLRRASARTRYRAACIMLAVLLVSLVLLGWIVWTKKPVTDWVIPPQKLLDSGGRWSSLANEKNSWLTAVIGMVTPVSVVVAALWILAAAGSMVWLLVSWRRVQKLLRSGWPVSDAELPQIHELQTRLIPGRKVQVRLTRALTGPATAGWMQPVILLPESTVQNLTVDQMRCVLAHELAHIQRRDYLVNLGQTMCDLVLVYHPLAWRISADIRNIREECCDDIAAAVAGGVKQYGKALLAMDELAERSKLAQQVTGGSLYDRVERLIRSRNTPDRESPTRFAVSIVLACVVLLGATIVLARATEHARIEADIRHMHFGKVIAREVGLNRDPANVRLAPEMKRLVERFKDPYAIPSDELERIVDALSEGTRGNELICEQLPYVDLADILHDFTPDPVPVGYAAYWGRVAVRIWRCGKELPSASERRRWGNAAVSLACQESFGFTYLVFILKDPDALQILGWTPAIGNRVTRTLIYSIERDGAATDYTAPLATPRVLKGIPFSQVAFNPRGAMLYARNAQTRAEIGVALNEMRPYQNDPVVRQLCDLLEAERRADRSF